MTCRFCEIIEDGSDLIFTGYRYAAAFYDRYPSAPGHTLIVPTRHVARVHELDRDEWQALMDLAFDLITESEGDLTVGINEGALAGQTIPHVHLHLIPRSPGDVPDPRGGVRWVLPHTAAYWAASQESASHEAVSDAR